MHITWCILNIIVILIVRSLQLLKAHFPIHIINFVFNSNQKPLNNSHSTTKQRNQIVGGTLQTKRGPNEILSSLPSAKFGQRNYHN